MDVDDADESRADDARAERRQRPRLGGGHGRTLLRMPSAPRTEPAVGDATDAAAWRGRLVELMADHRVPGATLGILMASAIAPR